jgi:hypothetical protein
VEKGARLALYCPHGTGESAMYRELLISAAIGATMALAIGWWVTTLS